MPSPSSTPALDDDFLDELPPLDGATEPEVEPDYADLVDDDEASAADDPLDDRTGEDDPVGEDELDTLDAKRESGWLEDDEDAENLDIGGADVVTFTAEESALADDPEPILDGEDFGFGGDESATTLDGGEEGPTGADDELSEEDLPRLDADEEGEVEDADIADPTFEPSEGAAVWATRTWTPVGAPLDIGPVAAIACGPRGVVASAKNNLVRVDLEGGATPLAAKGLTGAVASLAAAGAALVARTEEGALFVSTDDGASFRVVASGVRDAVLSLGALWVLTTEGTVRRSRDLGASWEDVATRAPALAIASTHAGDVVLLLSDALVRDPDFALALPEPATRGAVLAARGHFAAYAVPKRVRVVDTTAAAPAWTTADAPQTVAAAFLDDAGTLLAASYRDADDATWLVRVDARGASTVVAEIGAPPDDEDADAGKVRAIACDDARGVVWVGGGFGVVAYEL